MDNKRLYKSTIDKKIAGVCGGVAKYLEIDPAIIRLAWVAVTLVCGLGIVMYIAAALILSNDPDEVITKRENNYGYNAQNFSSANNAWDENPDVVVDVDPENVATEKDK